MNAVPESPMPSNDKPKRELRRCFVSGPSGPVTTAVAGMLASRGIEVLTVGSIGVGMSITQEILRMIASADFVVAVLTSDGRDNTMYELGFSRSLGKPALVFSLGGPLAFDLQGLYVRTLDRPEQITDAADDIDRFLRNAKPTPPLMDNAPSASLGDLDWARKELLLLRSGNLHKRGEQFEKLVARVFESAGAEVLPTGLNVEDQGVDFVVWLNEIAYELGGGPVLVECKSLLGGAGSVIKNSEVYVKQLSRTLSKSNASLALLIFDHDRSKSPPSLFETAQVLSFSIDDLIEQLEKGTFEQETIRRRRRATFVQGAKQ
jgi:Restriction endonuclease